MNSDKQPTTSNEPSKNQDNRMQNGSNKDKSPSTNGSSTNSGSYGSSTQVQGSSDQANKGDKQGQVAPGKDKPSDTPFRQNKVSTDKTV